MFDSKGWNLRLEGLHGALGPFEGALGLEFGKVDFSAQGAEAFVPTTATRAAAAFIYEEVRRETWKFSGGARVESAKIDAQEFAAAGQPAGSVTFTPYSLALGALYEFDRTWGLGANLQHTQRAPAAQELFADGPHLATGQFEVGDRGLDKVSATSLDVTLRQRGDTFTGSLSVFYADYSNYIGLIPTGIWRNPEDRSVVPGPEPSVDPDTGKPSTPIQQFDYRQFRARFYGFEIQSVLPLWREGANKLSMKLQADYVRAVDRSNDQSLPFMPPLRFGVSATCERGRLTATLGGLFAAAQVKVPQFQTTTPGYANVFANATWRWPLGEGVTLEAYLQGTNLLDQTIRSSTSNLKDIAPAGARAVLAGVRGVF